MQNQKGFDLAHKKLMIGLPAYDHKVGLKMAVSLMRFGQMAVEHGINLQISSICGCSVVSRARNIIANEFLKSDCDNLMFIDSDMTFQPEDLLRLFAFGQEKAIVAGAYEARKEGKIYILTLDGDSGSIYMDKMGLVRAKRVATGFMMIKREVFTTLAEKHPEWYHRDTSSEEMLYSFFDFDVRPEGMIGEDFLFCERTLEAGFSIWLDPSIKLGHMGVHEFQSDFGNDLLYPMMRKAEEAKLENKPMSDAA